MKRNSLKDYFMEKVYPILTPLASGSESPVSLHLAAECQHRTDGPCTGRGEVYGRGKVEESRFVRIKVPSLVPRLVPVGSSGTRFVLLEEIIEANIQALFPGMNPGPCHRFRVTRDADIEIREEEAEDLLSQIQEELRRRQVRHTGSSGSVAGHAGRHDRISDHFARSRGRRCLRFRRSVAHSGSNGAL